MYVGEIRLVAFDLGSRQPGTWTICDGHMENPGSYGQLFQMIGTTFGGDGATTFAMPDLRARIPVGYGQPPHLSNYALGQQGGVETVTLAPGQVAPHAHVAMAASGAGDQTSPSGNYWAQSTLNQFSNVAPTAQMNAQLIQSGGGQAQPAAHENMMPFQVLNYMIALYGAPPPSPEESYCGEIRLLPYATTPAGWLPCDGSTFPLSGGPYLRLFSVVGTAFGGDGRTTWAVPDLRGRTPLGIANHGAGLGEVGGEEMHQLTQPEMPSAYGHTHGVLASSGDASTGNPSGAAWAVTSASAYARNSTAAMSPAAISPGGQPHPNLQPYTALAYFISYQGPNPTS